MARKSYGVHPLVEELKSIRKRRNMSQAHVAKIAGISSDWIGLAESGRINPSVHMLGYLAGAFDLKIALVPAEKRP